MPRSTETLSRLQFYVLHQEIVAQCRAWLQEKANLGLMDDTEPLFYGFANGEPVLSTKLQRDTLEDALGELMQSLQGQSSGNPADIAAFEPAARKVLEKWMLGHKPEVPFINFEIFNRDVIRFLDQLVAQFPLISNYYYSWPKKDPSSKTNRSPKIVLIEEYEIMQKSRAFLLIVPNNRLFSSCWVQVGWAIMLEIPIFIIYRNEFDLPFILQKADSLHYNIEMRQLRPGEKLISTIDWFRDNAFGQKFFS